MGTVKETLLADPRVESISDERFGETGPEAGDGIWVYFKPGWFNPTDEIHSIHEYTWSECRARMKWVEPCKADCECKRTRG